MNKKVMKFGVFLGILLFLVSRGGAADLDQLSTVISQAVAKGESTVKVSYEMETAEDAEIQDAFQKIVEVATQNFVEQDRLNTVEALVQNKIYKKARNFILNYHKGSLLDVTLNLKALEQALVESKIIQIDYSQHKVFFLKVNHYANYQFIKEALEKRIKNLKRMVEFYQKKGEIDTLLEASTSTDDILASINEIKKQEGAPIFDAHRDDLGNIKIIFSGP